MTGPGLPDTIGRYRIVGRLGAGGMGVVFEGIDPELRREVAIKIVRVAGKGAGSRGEERRSVLLQEARALARLAHPHVVTIYDVGEVDGAVFLAMEKLQGETIDAWVARAAPTWQQRLSALHQAGEGLAAVHGLGIIHRDFKPENVMIVGEPPIAKVLDFGLAIDAPTASTPTASDSRADARVSLPQGTPGYMSPEQADGAPLDVRADVFSFCATAFEILYREPALEGDTPLDRVLAASEGRVRHPARASGVPRRILRELHRGLQRDPEARPVDMHELLRRLEIRPGRARRIAIGLATTAVLAAAAGAWLTGDDPECARLAELSEGWTDARWAAVEQGLRGVYLDQPQFLASARALIDARVEEWNAARKEACKASSRARPIDRGQVDCLEQWWRELDLVLSQIEAADAVVAEESIQAIEAVFVASWCETRPGVAPTARDASTPAEIADALAQARRATRAGDFERASAILGSLSSRLEPGSIAHLRVQEGLAGVLIALDDRRTAAKLYEDAYWAASSRGLDHLAARLAAKLSSMYGFLEKDLEQAALWERHLQTAVDRAPPSALEEGQLAYHRALADEAQGRHESAAERAGWGAERLAAFGRIEGVLLARRVQIRGLVRTRRASEALPIATDALRVASSMFPDSHDHVVSARNDLALVQDALASEPE